MSRRKRKLFESTMRLNSGEDGTGDDIQRAVAKAQLDGPPVIVTPSTRGAASTGTRKPTWQQAAVAATLAKGRKVNGKRK